MNCQIVASSNDGHFRCTNCGFTGRANPAHVPDRVFRACSRPGDALPAGPGTELHALLASLGVTPTATCGCASRIAQMDRWGVDGCRANREIIVAWVREGYQAASLGEKLAAGAKAITSGLGWLNPFEPHGSAVDEAIRRAEKYLKILASKEK